MKVETFTHKGSARVVFSNDDESWTMRHDDINCVDESLWERHIDDKLYVFSPDSGVEVCFEEDRKVINTWSPSTSKILWDGLVGIGFHRVNNGKRLTEVFRELDGDSTVMAISGSIPQEQLDAMLGKADVVKDWRKVYKLHEEEINSYEE